MTLLCLFTSAFTQELYLITTLRCLYLTSGWVVGYFILLHCISEGNIVLFTPYMHVTATVILQVQAVCSKTCDQLIKHGALLYIQLPNCF